MIYISRVHNLKSLCKHVTHQTECVPRQTCSAGQQMQTGKVSSSAGLRPQQHDAAIYTQSHSLDIHLKKKKKDKITDFISIYHLIVSHIQLCCTAHTHIKEWQDGTEAFKMAHFLSNARHAFPSNFCPRWLMTYGKLRDSAFHGCRDDTDWKTEECKDGWRGMSILLRDGTLSFLNAGLKDGT